MAKSYSRYEYETSPRKLVPSYDVPKKNPTKRKTEQKNEEKKKKLSKKKLKELRWKQFKTTCGIIAIFAIVFVISSRNAEIDENFAKSSELKSQLEEIKKENAQLEVSIESSLNLTTIEQQAKSLLGMQKLTSKQTEYIELPKTDYIEPAVENVKIEEQKGFFESVGDFFSQLFK